MSLKAYLDRYQFSAFSWVVAVLKSWVLLALLFASWMQIGQRRTLLRSPVTTADGSAGKGYVSFGPIYPFGERLTLQNRRHWYQRLCQSLLGHLLHSHLHRRQEQFSPSYSAP